MSFSQWDPTPSDTFAGLQPEQPHHYPFLPIEPSPSPSPSPPPSASWSGYDLPSTLSALGYTPPSNTLTDAQASTSQYRNTNQHSSFTTSYQAACHAPPAAATLQRPPVQSSVAHSSHPIQSGRAVLVEVNSNGPRTRGQGKKHGQMVENTNSGPPQKRPRVNGGQSGQSTRKRPSTQVTTPIQAAQATAHLPSPASNSTPAVYGVGPSSAAPTPTPTTGIAPTTSQATVGVPQSSSVTAPNAPRPAPTSRPSTRDAWLFTWPLNTNEVPTAFPDFDSEPLTTLMKERGNSQYLGCKLCL